VVSRHELLCKSAGLPWKNLNQNTFKKFNHNFLHMQGKKLNLKVLLKIASFLPNYMPIID
jgi:hypothetical protein